MYCRLIGFTNRRFRCAVNRRNGLRQKTLDALCTELVLLYLDGCAALLKAGDPAPGHQLQLALIIQLRRPTDGKFQPFPWEEDLVGGEENTVAADVDRLAGTCFLIRPVYSRSYSALPSQWESDPSFASQPNYSFGLQMLFAGTL